MSKLELWAKIRELLTAYRETGNDNFRHRAHNLMRRLQEAIKQ